MARHRRLSYLERDARGRFITTQAAVARIVAAWRPPAPPWRPPAAAILGNPTSDWPRYRLRVFDLCWPWRASLREVWQDAFASGNAARDRENGTTYLDACANIQRDPPPCRIVRWRGPRGDAA